MLALFTPSLKVTTSAGSSREVAESSLTRSAGHPAVHARATRSEMATLWSETAERLRPANPTEKVTAASTTTSGVADGEAEEDTEAPGLRDAD